MTPQSTEPNKVVAKKITCLSTGDSVWREAEAKLLKHIVTGEVMAYITHRGDGYGSGNSVTVSRYNKITGGYEQVDMPRYAMTDFKNPTVDSLEKGENNE